MAKSLEDIKKDFSSINKGDMICSCDSISNPDSIKRWEVTDIYPDGKNVVLTLKGKDGLYKGYLVRISVNRESSHGLGKIMYDSPSESMFFCDSHYLRKYIYNEMNKWEKALSRKIK